MNCPLCNQPAYISPSSTNIYRLQLLCNCGQKNGKFRSVMEFDSDSKPPMSRTMSIAKVNAWKERRKRQAE